MHPIFVNLKLVKKVFDHKDKEITKLAIGKPGGIDAETDMYDTQARVFCIPCN
jgi:hypothetical protein